MGRLPPKAPRVKSHGSRITHWIWVTGLSQRLCDLVQVSKTTSVSIYPKDGGITLSQVFVGVK